jgi:hypothetical protein
MPVIVNGSSNRCIWWWDRHLNSDVNEKAEIVKTYGLRGQTVRELLEEMQTLAAGTDCRNFFYQMNMNPAPGEILTAQDWDCARQIAEKEHGLEGQPYFQVMHTKHGRQHPHFVYLRVNLETGATISDSHDARTNHAIARKIEGELGLQKVIGPFDREKGTPRPERAPKRREMLRGMKSGINLLELKEDVTSLRQLSADGKEFETAMQTRGFIFARGDQIIAGEPALMVIDAAGDAHHLPRLIKGMTSKKVNEFMRHIDRASLPTITQAKQMQRDRKITQLEMDRATISREIRWEEDIAKAAIEKEKIEGFLAKEDRGTLPGGDREKAQPDASRDETQPLRDLLRALRADEKKERTAAAGSKTPARPIILPGPLPAVAIPAKAATGIVRTAGAALNIMGKPLAMLENLFEGQKLTPSQKLEGQIREREEQADARQEITRAASIAQQAEQQRQREQEQAARDRQREIERDRGK